MDRVDMISVRNQRERGREREREIRHATNLNIKNSMLFVLGLYQKNVGNREKIKAIVRQKE